MSKTKSVECQHCYDTGCLCGGIGLSCHGCCTCKAGQRARKRRERAVKQAVRLVQLIRGEQ